MSHDLVDCPHCRVAVRPVRPSVTDRLLLAGCWLVAMSMVAIGGLLGPFLFVLSPFLIVFGASLVRTGHERAFREPHCGRCETILPDALPRPHAMMDARDPHASSQEVSLARKAHA